MPHQQKQLGAESGLKYVLSCSPASPFAAAPRYGAAPGTAAACVWVLRPDQQAYPPSSQDLLA
jgi:hypothetical protein